MSLADSSLSETGGVEVLLCSTIAQVGGLLGGPRVEGEPTIRDFFLNPCFLDSLLCPLLSSLATNLLRTAKEL